MKCTLTHWYEPSVFRSKLDDWSGDSSGRSDNERIVNDLEEAPRHRALRWWLELNKHLMGDVETAFEFRVWRENTKKSNVPNTQVERTKMIGDCRCHAQTSQKGSAILWAAETSEILILAMCDKLRIKHGGGMIGGSYNVWFGKIRPRQTAFECIALQHVYTEKQPSLCLESRANLGKTWELLDMVWFVVVPISFFAYKFGWGRWTIIMFIRTFAIWWFRLFLSFNAVGLGSAMATIRSIFKEIIDWTIA